LRLVDENYLTVLPIPEPFSRSPFLEVEFIVFLFEAVLQGRHVSEMLTFVPKPLLYIPDADLNAEVTVSKFRVRKGTGIYLQIFFFLSPHGETCLSNFTFGRCGAQPFKCRYKILSEATSLTFVLNLANVHQGVVIWNLLPPVGKYPLGHSRAYGEPLST
jgi:hypothetical protein